MKEITFPVHETAKGGYHVEVAGIIRLAKGEAVEEPNENIRRVIKYYYNGGLETTQTINLRY